MTLFTNQPLFGTSYGHCAENLERRRAADAERRAREAVAAARSAYYKCGDCLAVAVVKPEDKAKIARGARPECGVCGGTFEFMGDVGRDAKCEVREERCACDMRCTDALGPNCECSCGGENHGSGRTIEVLVSVEGRPRFLGVKDAEKSRKIAEEYRTAMKTARESVDARYGNLLARRSRGEYLSGPDFSAYLRAVKLGRAIHATREARCHKTRMKKLADVVAATAK